MGASTATPYIGINGISPDQLTAAMNAATLVMGLTTGALPLQTQKTLNGNLKFSSFQCFMNPWDGTYLESKKRHA